MNELLYAAALHADAKAIARARGELMGGAPGAPGTTNGRGRLTEDTRAERVLAAINAGAVTIHQIRDATSLRSSAISVATTALAADGRISTIRYGRGLRFGVAV